MSDRAKCPTHDIVLIERFDEESRPGLAIPTGEFYCWKCEHVERTGDSDLDLALWEDGEL